MRESLYAFTLYPAVEALTMYLFLHCRIGLAIARRLAEDGAHVVISSRKQENVDRAVAKLQGEGLSVSGIVCHVGKPEDRERLVTTVSRKDMGSGPRGGRREAACTFIPDFKTALMRYSPALTPASIPVPHPN